LRIRCKGQLGPSPFCGSPCVELGALSLAADLAWLNPAALSAAAGSDVGCLGSGPVAP
jgi:hypothetical protein